jgi:WD40 repeat protein
MPNFTKPTQAWNLQWDADWVTAVTFLGSSRLVAAGNNLGQILLWELPAKVEKGEATPKPVARLDAHTNVISHLASSPDGKTLISASYDHTIRYWDIPAKLPEATEPILLNARTIEDTTRRKSNGAKVPPPNEAKVCVLKPARTLAEHKEWVVGMQLSHDGKTLISGDDGGHVIIWNVASGTVKTRWKLAKGWVYGVAISPDAKQACVTERLPLVFDSGRHAAVKLWDTATGTVTKDLSAEKVFKGHHMCAAAYSRDGKQLAILRGGESGGLSGKPVLVDPISGKIVKELGPQGHLDGGTNLAWHRDNKHLASTGRDTQVRIWDTAAGKLVAEVAKGRGGQFKDWLCSAAWSADGNWIAAADMAGAVQVWTFAG